MAGKLSDTKRLSETKRLPGHKDLKEEHFRNVDGTFSLEMQRPY
jgi:hypothetical protein